MCAGPAAFFAPLLARAGRASALGVLRSCAVGAAAVPAGLVGQRQHASRAAATNSHTKRPLRFDGDSLRPFLLAAERRAQAGAVSESQTRPVLSVWGDASGGQAGWGAHFSDPALPLGVTGRLPPAELRAIQHPSGYHDHGLLHVLRYLARRYGLQGVTVRYHSPQTGFYLVCTPHRQLTHASDPSTPIMRQILQLNDEKSIRLHVIDINGKAREMLLADKLSRMGPAHWRLSKQPSVRGPAQAPVGAASKHAHATVPQPAADDKQGGQAAEQQPGTEHEGVLRTARTEQKVSAPLPCFVLFALTPLCLPEQSMLARADYAPAIYLSCLSSTNVPCLLTQDQPMSAGDRQSVLYHPFPSVVQHIYGQTLAGYPI